MTQTQYSQYDKNVKTAMLVTAIIGCLGGGALFMNFLSFVKQQGKNESDMINMKRDIQDIKGMVKDQGDKLDRCFQMPMAEFKPVYQDTKKMANR